MLIATKDKMFPTTITGSLPRPHDGLWAERRVHPGPRGSTSSGIDFVVNPSAIHRLRQVGSRVTHQEARCKAPTRGRR